ncbi:target of Nesh-SH3-like [Saccoglossus kowalevskii]|uniref:Fibronectin type III domain-containing protein 1-like n=1 Tax=Saccoglossus kowalevskii TaxID=10224 RepID=A0ABM0M606_SACKO|nr:PREDICTED: fibronectin type III domain-containing protein 1-like [Saccoglossus kowalevskii]
MTYTVYADSWTAFNFNYYNTWRLCDGDRYVKLSGYDVGYYVGVILCDQSRYKILLSDTIDGEFYDIGDGAGTGQDNCEFIGGEFEAWTVDPDYYNAPSVIGFFRNQWGEIPSMGTIGTADSKFYGRWMECGLVIP